MLRIHPLRSLQLYIVPPLLILLSCSLWPEMEILVPSLPAMKSFFGVSDGNIQQLLSANYLGYIVGVLLSGPLCDAWGRRATLILGGIFYLLSSFGIAVSSSFTLVIVFRCFQGFFMTAPIVAGTVMMLEGTTGSRRIFWLSLGNTAITLSMALAPILGTAVNSSFGFSGNLWAIFILGVIGIIPVIAFVSESRVIERRQRVDWKNVGITYVNIMLDGRFMRAVIPVCASMAGYWVYIGVSALFIVDHLGLPAEQFVLYQAPIAGTYATVSLTSAWLWRRFGLKNCVRSGFGLMALGVAAIFYASLLGKESADGITLGMMIYVIGQVPLCNMLYPLAANHLPVDTQGKAQALIQALRLLLASIGTFALTFAYTGPFLPVAIILLLFLLLGAWALFGNREFLDDMSKESYI